jgi:hypothetical protein
MDAPRLFRDTFLLRHPTQANVILEELEVLLHDGEAARAFHDLDHDREVRSLQAEGHSIQKRFTGQLKGTHAIKC